MLFHNARTNKTRNGVMEKTTSITTCFLFEGFSRIKLLEKYQQGESPDTLFWGYNHLLQSALLAPRVVDLSDRPTASGFFKHLLYFLQTTKELSRYDVVISSVGVPYLIAHILSIFRRPAWVFLNFNFSHVIKRRSRLSLKRYLFVWALKHARHIFCFSNAQINDLRESGISQEKLSLLHFGVDYDFFHKVVDQVPSEYFLSVGRDIGRDYETLIEAARLVPHKIVIITSLRNMVGIQNLPPNVSILYDLPYSEVRKFYQGALAILVVSQPDEVLTGSDCSGQMTILDALASGKPVVATKKDWIGDYFNNNEVSIVPPKDPINLALKIRWVAENPEEASTMAQKGERMVKSRFNTIVMSKVIEQKIKEIYAP